MSAWHWAGLAVLAWLGLWLLILLAYARPARAAWREPVLRHPVLIIESDDWGPGPAPHAAALDRVAACLQKHRDATGRPAVMTLGLTLTLPDSQAMAGSDPLTYQALPLTAPPYAALLAALRAGIAAGVFAPQLHGLAHYWPDALVSAARNDPNVRDWLLAGPGQETESLPSPLQSRWVDGSVLPSRPLSQAQIRAAVAEEVGLYRQIFGATPEVVVPPTFVWTPGVEAAWAQEGVSAIITPGHPCTGRDAQGRPACTATPLHNGQAGLGGVTYLVRDRYFEPALGHRAQRGLTALADKTAQGRPCLLETHRFNFTGAGQDDALAQLDQLLAAALAQSPDVRFLSAAELARAYQGGDLLEPRLKPRLAAWRTRMEALPRFRKLARLSGLSGVLPTLSARQP